MIRVVLDTNVIVSAMLVPAGAEAAALRLALGGAVALGISEPLLVEYENVLRRPKFKRPTEVVDSLLADIRSVGHGVRPKRTVSVISHESDNRFLECAEAFTAHFLITGNTRHFPSRWKSTRIVNARKFIEEFAADELEDDIGVRNPKIQKQIAASRNDYKKGNVRNARDLLSELKQGHKKRKGGGKPI